MKDFDYRAALKAELAKRCEKRVGYSLRAFARDLSMDPSHLSRVMNGKQRLSLGFAQLIAEKLFRSTREKELFVAAVELAASKREEARELALKKIARLQPADEADLLSLETLRVLGEWYHVAIMDLTALSDFEFSADSISAYLGISRIEAKLAVERLEGLGLIRKEPSGRWIKTHAKLASPNGVPSSALRKLHRQLITKAINSLESQSVDRRYVVGKTVVIDRADLPKYKALVEEFRSRVGELSQSSPARNALYQVNVQLFDLSVKERAQA